MSVDIASEVRRIWPTTEGKLTAASEVDYAEEKARAINRAKLALYGDITIPDEADIPDRAAYWIADQAVLFLIPAARDYYALMRRVSDSKEGATVTYHNMTTALDSLENQLRGDVAKNKAEALDAISATEAIDDMPAVSTAGLIVDPIQRAMSRGPLMQ